MQVKRNINGLIMSRLEKYTGFAILLATFVLCWPRVSAAERRADAPYAVVTAGVPDPEAKA